VTDADTLPAECPAAVRQPEVEAGALPAETLGLGGGPAGGQMPGDTGLTALPLELEALLAAAGVVAPAAARLLLWKGGSGVPAPQQGAAK
jgi:hypothetical protein